MAKASDNAFPSVLFDEQGTAPTTPSTGLWRAYFKSDGLYIVDDAGAETGPLGSGGGGGGSFVGARASLSTTQAVADSTDVPVLWDTEDFDVGGLIDVAGANPSRFTIPAGEGGKYEVSGQVVYAAGASGLSYQIQIFVNSTNVAHRLNRFPSTSAETSGIHTVLDLAAGDVVEIVARQATGASRNIGTLGTVGNFASVTKLG